MGKVTSSPTELDAVTYCNVTASDVQDLKEQRAPTDSGRISQEQLCFLYLPAGPRGPEEAADVFREAQFAASLLAVTGHFNARTSSLAIPPPSYLLPILCSGHF